MNRKTPSQHATLHAQAVRQAVQNAAQNFQTATKKLRNAHSHSVTIDQKEPKAAAKICQKGHKTVITISAPTFSKSIAIGYRAKKTLQFTAAFLAGFFIVGSGVIAYSATNIMELQTRVQLVSKSYLDAIKENKTLKETLAENGMQQEKEQAAKELTAAKSDDATQAEIAQLVNMSPEQKKMLLRNIPNGYPVSFDGITSSFGSRNHPLLGRSIFHEGDDFRSPSGAAAYATADGIVEYAKPDGGYGNKLVITHSYGFKTVYGHLSRYAVKGGDFVKKGQLIAYTGNTGLSAGPHLHYEVRFLGEPLNPTNFVRWNDKNFEYLFTMERRVRWASLVEATRWQTTQTAQASSQTAQKLLASLK